MSARIRGGLSSEREQALAEFQLRAKLYARDGLLGDQDAMHEAAAIALGVAEGPPDPPREVFEECAVGGQFKRRMVKVGDFIGETTVLRAANIAGFGAKPQDDRSARRGRVFEIECAGCRKIQLRTNGQLNSCLRRRGSVECPECVRERCRGGRHSYSAFLVERVRDGGPIYTEKEIRSITTDIWRALEEEFGPARDPDEDLDVDHLQISAGFPYSKAAEVRSCQTRREQKREEEREAARRKKMGVSLADLLRATSSGDVEALYKASGDVEKITKAQRRAYDPRAIEAALERAKDAEEERRSEERAREVAIETALERTRVTHMRTRSRVTISVEPMSDDSFTVPAGYPVRALAFGLPACPRGWAKLELTHPDHGIVKGFTEAANLIEAQFFSTQTGQASAEFTEVLERFRK